MPRLIEPGTIVFIDANILLYAVSGHWKFGTSSKCLLDFINDGEYKGITSVLVCNECSRARALKGISEQNLFSELG